MGLIKYCVAAARVVNAVGSTNAGLPEGNVVTTAVGVATQPTMSVQANLHKYLCKFAVNGMIH